MGGSVCSSSERPDININDDFLMGSEGSGGRGGAGEEEGREKRREREKERKNKMERRKRGRKGIKKTFKSSLGLVHQFHDSEKIVETIDWLHEAVKDILGCSRKVKNKVCIFAKMSKCWYFAPMSALILEWMPEMDSL